MSYGVYKVAPQNNFLDRHMDGQTDIITKSLPATSMPGDKKNAMLVKLVHYVYAVLK